MRAKTLGLGKQSRRSLSALLHTGLLVGRPNAMAGQRLCGYRAPTTVRHERSHTHIGG